MKHEHNEDDEHDEHDEHDENEKHDEHRGRRTRRLQLSFIDGAIPTSDTRLLDLVRSKLQRQEQHEHDRINTCKYMGCL